MGPLYPWGIHSRATGRHQILWIMKSVAGGPQRTTSHWKCLLVAFKRFSETQGYFINFCLLRILMKDIVLQEACTHKHPSGTSILPPQEKGDSAPHTAKPNPCYNVLMLHLTSVCPTSFWPLGCAIITAMMCIEVRMPCIFLLEAMGGGNNSIILKDSRWFDTGCKVLVFKALYVLDTSYLRTISWNVKLSTYEDLLWSLTLCSKWS